MRFLAIANEGLDAATAAMEAFLCISRITPLHILATERREYILAMALPVADPYLKLVLIVHRHPLDDVPRVGDVAIKQSKQTPYAWSGAGKEQTQTPSSAAAVQLDRHCFTQTNAKRTSVVLDDGMMAAWETANRVQRNSTASLAR